ncbi:hypothetical protein BpHYR1_010385 [Brachionus plicatilis]|uniref:Uncharacterized protein n=1 Tax=Brachionus plicatilis TaxID=10195 RepID=A0A3M7SW96_BRAPC|nr:hypothetical protein BpHYR1_010385 [Brachionus plicatilis]
MFPAAYILLQNKERETYIKAFTSNVKYYKCQIKKYQIFLITVKFSSKNLLCQYFSHFSGSLSTCDLTQS